MKRRALSIVSGLGVLLLPGALAAQGVAVSVSRWLTSPYVMAYRVGVSGFDRSIFRFVISGEYVNQSGASLAHWYGGTGDVLIRATPAAIPYLVAGGGAGAGRGPLGGGEAPGWGLWGGMGAELVTLGPLGLQAEGLYTWRSRVHLSGISLGLRFGTRIGKREASASLTPSGAVSPGGAAPAGAPPAQAPSGTAPVTPPPAEALPRPNPADEEAIRLATAGSPLPPAPAPGAAPAPGGAAPRTAAADVVVTAVGAMGTPYQWGGTEATGYDCSGLIQYAYAQHGISIPRRSVDQAAAGEEVGRRLEALRPGDILTFSGEPGGSVSHVGLYVGNGRFIHSATKGVQISILRGDDPAVKWWWERWIGARRVVE
jgi:cell wall-associated NlpC family hydrolase